MTEPLTFTLEEAAARLSGPFTADWLRGHLDEIPDIKLGSGRGRGGRIGFTETQLHAIVAQFTVTPASPVASVCFTAVTRRSLVDLTRH